ncbi:MAG: sigma-70 family RNA polymerase sigma factor [Chitinivibrionales bacterium]|nr:sigma-70 family RNA polymerase sigma factor [Chitinivibrionales bacterium]
MARKSLVESHLLTEDGSLALYLKEIGKCKPLHATEEAALAARIRKGDRKALEKLVHANLRFVVSVCKNYQNQGLPLCDLINEGNLGLIKAAGRFDEKKNFKFISYAVWWIRQAILQALAEQSRITKLPLNRVGTIHKIGKTQSRLEQKYRRLPNTEEIAAELGMKERDVRDALRIGPRHASFDAPLFNNETAQMLDVYFDKDQVRPDESITEISLQEEIFRNLNTLSFRQREVLCLYFGIGEDTAHTLEEIGIRLNLTRERVRQIKEKGLRNLKCSQRFEKLKAYQN